MERVEDDRDHGCRQRQEIFDVEDVIEAKWDALTAALDRRLNQCSPCVPVPAALEPI